MGSHPIYQKDRAAKAQLVPAIIGVYLCASAVPLMKPQMHADARRFQKRPACRSGLLFLAVLALGNSGIAQEMTSRPQDARALVTRHLDMNYNMPVYQTKEQWLERKE